jgi:hypothetical protein
MGRHFGGDRIDIDDPTAQGDHGICRSPDDRTDVRSARAHRAAPAFGAARTLVMRFIVTLIPAIFVVNILSASIIGFNAARVVKKELRTKQAELLKTRARLIAEPLWNLRYEGVAAALQDLNNDPNVLGVAVEDASGAVVTRLGQPEAADPSARLSISIEYANADTRATIGNIAIAFDPGRAYLQIRDSSPAV